MKQFKKVLSMLIVVCMIVPMATMMTVPTSAAAGTVIDDGAAGTKNDGVCYTFENLGEAESYYSSESYAAENGLEVVNESKVWGFSNDSEDNLVITNTTRAGDVKLMLKDGSYDFPKTYSNLFCWINVVVIRYKIVDNTAEYMGSGKTLKFYTGNTVGTTSAQSYDFVVPENGEWVETVLDLNAELTHFGSGNPYLLFPELAEGASIVIDYFGLYGNRVTAETVHSIVPAPTMSAQSGGFFYDNPTVAITPADGTEVYYTVDGSTPSASNGTLYDGTEIAINGYTTVKVVPVATDTKKSGYVSEYIYWISDDRSKKIDNSGIIRFTEDNPMTLYTDTGNAYSRDADGNLIVDTVGTTKDEILFVVGTTNYNNIHYTLNWAKYVVVRYKIENAVAGKDYGATTARAYPQSYEPNISSVETDSVGNGWYETVITLGAAYGHTNYNNLYFIDLPDLTDGEKYVIDYLGFFKTATDMEPLMTQYRSYDIVSAPKMSAQSGGFFYDNPTVTITPADGTKVYYTVDGSTPSVSNGTLYNGTPIAINGYTKLNVVPVKMVTHEVGDVDEYTYWISNDRTLNTSNSGILRFTGDDPFTTLGTTHNDADGNLVIDTPHTSGELLFKDYINTNGNIQFKLALATHIVVRYKVSGAEYSDSYTNNIAFSFMNNGAVTALSNKSQKTVAVGDGWYETTTELTAVAGSFQYGLYYVNFDNLPTGQNYIIDYIGFFMDVDEMEELKARYRIYDDQSVMLGGAQVKDEGSGVRFVGSIDNYQSDVYEEIGFKLKANGVAANKNLVVNKVYDSIIAADKVITADMIAAAQSNGKLFTYCVNGITTNVTFEVCVYARIGGTEICGDTYTYLYNVSENSLSLIK